MNANENIRNEVQDGDVVELGVASVETRGMLPEGDEEFGRIVGVGITE
ncbi:hypothetical protein [Luteimonas abyssi]|nr:hypothetical protein [Luteimonas abyssi]